MVVYVNMALYALCFQLQGLAAPMFFRQHRRARAAASGGCLYAEDNCRCAEAKLAQGLCGGPPGCYKTTQEQCLTNSDTWTGGSDADALAIRVESMIKCFGMMQLLGSLGIGILMDVFGIRSCFFICFVSSALAYGLRWLAGASGSLGLLFLSELPGIFQCAMLIAQTWLLQHLPLEQRPSALAWLGMAYQLGARQADRTYRLVESAGGGPYEAAALAALLSLLSSALCSLLPAPSSTASTAPCDILPGHYLRPLRSLGFAKVRAVAARSTTWTFIGLMVASSVSAALVSSTFGQILGSKFGYGAGQIGEAVGSIRDLTTIVGLLAVWLLPRWLKPAVMVPACLALQGCFELAQAISLSDALVAPERHWMFLGSSVVIITCSWLMDALFTIYLTAAVETDERGTCMGFIHAWHALPIAGTSSLAFALFGLGGAPAVYCGASALSLAMFLQVRTLVLPRYEVKDG